MEIYVESKLCTIRHLNKTAVCMFLVFYNHPRRYYETLKTARNPKKSLTVPLPEKFRPCAECVFTADPKQKQ